MLTRALVCAGERVFVTFTRPCWAGAVRISWEGHSRAAMARQPLMEKKIVSWVYQLRFFVANSHSACSNSSFSMRCWVS